MKFLFAFCLIYVFLTSLYAEVVKVDSTKKWNDSYGKFSKENTVVIDVNPPTQKWGDINGKMNVTAEGYPNAPGIELRYNNADKSEPIFALICCVNHNMATCTHVGLSGKIEISESGFVSCFANDSEFTYGNNVGSIDVDVTLA
jgi:hypothetical protein